MEFQFRVHGLTFDEIGDLKAMAEQDAIVIKAQKQRILGLVKEIQDAQQERTALLVTNRAHQHTNESLRRTNDHLKAYTEDLKKTAVDLRVTVESLSKGLEIATRLLYT